MMIILMPKIEEMVRLNIFKPEIGIDWATTIIYRYVYS
jgi:hypothetical protein